MKIYLVPYMVRMELAFGSKMGKRIDKAEVEISGSDNK